MNWGEEKGWGLGRDRVSDWEAFADDVGAEEGQEARKRNSRRKKKREKR
jgi:hypothetical protein